MLLRSSKSFDCLPTYKETHEVDAPQNDKLTKKPNWTAQTNNGELIQIQKLRDKIASCLKSNRGKYEKIKRIDDSFEHSLYIPRLRVRTGKQDMNLTKQILSKQLDLLLDEELSFKKQLSKYFFTFDEDGRAGEFQEAQLACHYSFLRRLWIDSYACSSSQDRIDQINQKVIDVKQCISKIIQSEEQSYDLRKYDRSCIIETKEYQGLMEKYSRLELENQELKQKYLEVKQNENNLKQDNCKLKIEINAMKQQILKFKENQIENQKKIKDLSIQHENCAKKMHELLAQISKNNDDMHSKSLFKIYKCKSESNQLEEDSFLELRVYIGKCNKAKLLNWSSFFMNMLPQDQLIKKIRAFLQQPRPSELITPQNEHQTTALKQTDAFSQKLQIRLKQLKKSYDQKIQIAKAAKVQNGRSKKIVENKSVECNKRRTIKSKE